MKTRITYFNNLNEPAHYDFESEDALRYDSWADEKILVKFIFCICPKFTILFLLEQR